VGNIHGRILSWGAPVHVIFCAFSVTIKWVRILPTPFTGVLFTFMGKGMTYYGAGLFFSGNGVSRVGTSAGLGAAVDCQHSQDRLALLTCMILCGCHCALSA
jgi:hypothetical protein